MGQHSEHLRGAGMVRLMGQDLPVDRVGLGEASLLVVQHGQIKGLFEGQGRHRAGFYRKAR
jgi:hypothetical protein